jgi:hypothetical protein
VLKCFFRKMELHLVPSVQLPLESTVTGVSIGEAGIKVSVTQMEL